MPLCCPPSCSSCSHYRSPHVPTTSIKTSALCVKPPNNAFTEFNCCCNTFYFMEMEMFKFKMTAPRFPSSSFRTGLFIFHSYLHCLHHPFLPYFIVFFHYFPSLLNFASFFPSIFIIPLLPLLSFLFLSSPTCLYFPSPQVWQLWWICLLRPI